MIPNKNKYFAATAIMLLMAYNPYTTFLFNSTGFYGASLHQLSMCIGWVVFIFLTFKRFLSVITIRDLAILFIIIAYSTLSLMHGSNSGSLMASFADVSYLVEFWFFYVAAKTISYYLNTNEVYWLLIFIFVINAVGLIAFYFILPTELYFTLQLGSVRVNRSIDFLIVSGLFLLIFASRNRGHNFLTYNILLSIFITANIIGFSRAVWLSIALVFFSLSFCNFFKVVLNAKFRFSIQNFLTSISGVLLVIYVQIKFSFFSVILDRILNFEYESASIGGRISSYLSLFYTTLESPKLIFFGMGAGANMPNLDIPASSSPTFFGTVAYVHGLFFLTFFILFYAYFIWALSKKFMKFGSGFEKYAVLNLIVHAIILNIFPSISHFPILGFLTFTSVYAIHRRSL